MVAFGANPATVLGASLGNAALGKGLAISTGAIWAAAVPLASGAFFVLFNEARRARAVFFPRAHARTRTRAPISRG